MIGGGSGFRGMELSGSRWPGAMQEIDSRDGCPALAHPRIPDQVQRGKLPPSDEVSQVVLGNGALLGTLPRVIPLHTVWGLLRRLNLLPLRARKIGGANPGKRDHHYQIEEGPGVGY